MESAISVAIDDTPALHSGRNGCVLGEPGVHAVLHNGGRNRCGGEGEMGVRERTRGRNAATCPNGANQFAATVAPLLISQSSRPSGVSPTKPFSRI